MREVNHWYLVWDWYTHPKLRNAEVKYNENKNIARSIYMKAKTFNFGEIPELPIESRARQKRQR